MDNTVLNAFIPLLSAVITEALQILVEIVKGGQVKWWRTMVITGAVAIAATAVTLLMISKATTCAITNVGWMPYSNDGMESSITVTPVIGSNCAFQVSFDLKKQGGYVATYKKLEQGLLAWWIKGIEFSYSGMGNPNTMEFKLISESSTYRIVLPHTTNTGGKTSSWKIPYVSLTAPADGKIFNRTDFKLDRIDFTFSSWQGDTPGTGNVVIQDIRVILAWQIWIIIFSPIVLVTVIAYVLWRKRISS